MENHISHHPIHLDTLDCFLFLLCHICLQLVGYATVSLVTLFSTLDASLHAAQAHFVGHEKKKRPGFSHMKQYKLPLPRDSEGELPPIRENSLSSSYLPLLLQHFKNAHFQSFFQPHNTEVAFRHPTIFHALATIHIQILHIELHTFP